MGRSLISPTGDVIVQRSLLAFQLLHALFHDVTDADDADESVVLHNGNVPDPLVGHQRAEVIYGVGGRARGDHRRHDLRDRQPQQIAATFVQFAHDVTLRDDAHHTVGGHDDHGTDVVQ